MKSSTSQSCLLLAILLAATASAQNAEQQPGQLPERLQVCAALQNSTERLSCYDRTVASLGKDQAPEQTSALSPEAMFGVNGLLSREATPAKAAPREEMQSITAKVKALRTTPGALLIDLDNGQTWQQMDQAVLLLKVGDEITITRGAFNAFRLNTPSKRFGRVRRAL